MSIKKYIENISNNFIISKCVCKINSVLDEGVFDLKLKDPLRLAHVTTDSEKGIQVCFIVSKEEEGDLYWDLKRVLEGIEQYSKKLYFITSAGKFKYTHAAVTEGFIALTLSLDEKLPEFFDIDAFSKLTMIEYVDTKNSNHHWGSSVDVEDVGDFEIEIRSFYPSENYTPTWDFTIRIHGQEEDIEILALAFHPQVVGENVYRAKLIMDDLYVCSVAGSSNFGDFIEVEGSFYYGHTLAERHLNL